MTIWLRAGRPNNLPVGALAGALIWPGRDRPGFLVSRKNTMALELVGITKQVGSQTHIKETSLVLQPGHFNVLLGETGAGKTSLIKLMAGLDRVASGKILMNGQDVTSQSTQKRNIALVHQFFVNYPHMTVFENIASPLKVAGLAKSEIEGRVEEAADVLQLRPFLDRRPHELSGGQQQRCALARAIAKESNAVFLDEPLANLDYKLREELRDQLPELFAGRGAVVVYATSEPEEALLLGGKTGLMNDGRVTQFGETAAIYRNPMDLVSAQVFSDPPINTAQIEKLGNRAFFGAAVWELSGDAVGLQDGKYTMAIRPNYVLPVNTSDAFVPLLGKVQVAELSGSQSSAHFTLGAENWVSLSSGVHAFEIGEEHEFHMNPSKCFFFGPDGKRAV